MIYWLSIGACDCTFHFVGCACRNVVHRCLRLHAALCISAILVKDLRQDHRGLARRSVAPILTEHNIAIERIFSVKTWICCCASSCLHRFDGVVS